MPFHNYQKKLFPFLTNFNVPPSLLLRNTEIMTVFIKKSIKNCFAIKSSFNSQLAVSITITKNTNLVNSTKELSGKNKIVEKGCN